MANSNKEGFLSFIQREQQQTNLAHQGPGVAGESGVSIEQGQEVVPQSVLFARGQEISAMSWQDMVTRQAVEQVFYDNNRLLYNDTLILRHRPILLSHLHSHNNINTPITTCSQYKITTTGSCRRPIITPHQTAHQSQSRRVTRRY